MYQNSAVPASLSANYGQVIHPWGERPRNGEETALSGAFVAVQVKRHQFNVVEAEPIVMVLRDVGGKRLSFRVCGFVALPRPHDFVSQTNFHVHPCFEICNVHNPVPRASSAGWARTCSRCTSARVHPHGGTFRIGSTCSSPMVRSFDVVLYDPFTQSALRMQGLLIIEFP